MSKARLQLDCSIDKNDDVFDAVPFKQRRSSSTSISTSKYNEDFDIETLSSDVHQRRRSSMHSVDLDIEDTESNGQEKQEEKDDDNNAAATSNSRRGGNKKLYTMIILSVLVILLVACIAIGLSPDTKTNNHPLLQSGESSIEHIISGKWEKTNDIAANVTQN
jgi:hypothetical protein